MRHITLGEINNRFSQLIFEKILSVKRMFMTATPKIFLVTKIAMNDVLFERVLSIIFCRCYSKI